MKYVLYVYSLGLVLNLYSYFKEIKGSKFYSPFFIFKIFVWILSFNIFFEVLKRVYDVKFFNVNFILVIFIVSVILSFIHKKYVCISFSYVISYFILRFLNFSVSVKEIMFLIGSLHIFEGIFIIFQKDFLNLSYERGVLKFYLPLVLNKIPLIFLVFYRRNFKNKNEYYVRIISGVLIFFYGIIILLIGSFKSVYGLILSPFLHEGILFLERKFYIFLRKDRRRGKI